MDTDSLVARIDQLLKGRGGPPPDKVLKRVVEVLTKARQGGGEEVARDSSSDPLPSMDDLLASTPSSISSSMTASQRSVASSSSRAPSLTESSRTKAKPAAATNDVQEEENGLGGEHGMSLPLGRAPDMNHQRVLARHRERTEHLKVPVDIREKQRRQYQALLEGRGGKIVHADIVQNGATQIGGMTSQTPSMYGGPDTPMSQIASKIIAGGPPRIRNLPTDFRLA